jgi:hypothetical protein
MTHASHGLILLDCGRASKATHGDAYQWPMHENVAPPFNHFCPIC